MRKVFSVLTAMAMVVSLMGCQSASKPAEEAVTAEGTASEQGEPVELTFWGHQEASWNASYESIAADFMAENPNIKIKMEFFPYDQFESKVQTSLMSKEGGADIYELWGGWGIDFAPTGALAPLPDDMTAEIQEDSYAPTIGALEYDGKLYGMPMEFNIENGGLLVNNAMLNENGLEVPTSWDQLVTEAQKVVVMDGDLCMVKGFDFVNWDSVPYLLTSMILSQGGQYLQEDGSVDLTSAEAVKAFEELHSLIVDRQVTDLEGLTGGGEIEGYQQLFAGTALFVPRGPWTIAEGEHSFELKYGEDFQYVAMPWYGDNVAFAAETGWSMAVNAGSAEQEAAFKFLQYFYRDDVMMKHNVNCGMIPCKKAVAQDPALLEQMPYAEPLVGILDKAQFIGHFNSDQFKEAINNAFVDYCSGIYGSANEALSSATDTINGAK